MAMDEWNAIVARNWGYVGDDGERRVTIRECRDVAAELDALDELPATDLSDDEIVAVLDRAVAAQRLAMGRIPWSVWSTDHAA
jgi:hypothetical protein